MAHENMSQKFGSKKTQDDFLGFLKNSELHGICAEKSFRCIQNARTPEEAQKNLVSVLDRLDFEQIAVLKNKPYYFKIGPWKIYKHRARKMAVRRLIEETINPEALAQYISVPTAQTSEIFRPEENDFVNEAFREALFEIITDIREAA